MIHIIQEWVQGRPKQAGNIASAYDKTYPEPTVKKPSLDVMDVYSRSIVKKYPKNIYASERFHYVSKMYISDTFFCNHGHK